MDTIGYYDKWASDFYERTVDLEVEEIIEQFLELLPEDGAILDLGCGSGRDSLYFVNEGYDVTAIDGSKELCELAEIHIGQDVLNMKFEELEFNSVFDGVWACASLLHVPSEEMDEILEKVIASLKEDGVLYMSFKYGDFEGIRDGRYFVDYRTHRLRDLIKRHNKLELINIFLSKRINEEDSTEWINVLARKKEC